MEYNIYLLAVPTKDDTSPQDVFVTIPAKYHVVVQTNDISDEIICKIMRTMCRTAAGVLQDGV